ncbi:alpha/beta fold hydrolase [Sphaerimonospora mesophila]|uniref:alpha/beta fold hydrolase n=1 Tax=Sphaerimonospora mesophila TaxID=37483 RepID=UPI0006E25C47
MSTLVTPAARAPRADVRRINFRFSGRGRYATCLAGHGRRHLVPEVWDLTGEVPRSRVLRIHDGGAFSAVPVATDDGHVLLCRPGADGTNHLLLAVPARDAEGGAGAAEEYPLATVRDRGVRLLPGPAPGTAAMAFVTSADRDTTLLRLSGRAEAPQWIAGLPGLLRGGVWLDETGDRLAVTSDQAGTATVILDLVRGTLAPPAGWASDEHLLLAAPRTGVLVTAVRHEGAYRLGVRHRDSEDPSVFPERLNAIDGSVTPLALDPTGRRLALAATRGVRSHLLLHDLTDDATDEIDLPPGTLHPSARWTDSGLHLVLSTPDRPPGVVTVHDSSPPRGRPTREPGQTGWAAARPRTYDGPAGSIEAIVYGDPATSGQIVLALHGGPESSWQLGFDPLFQRLAEAGIAVVAPNQRGSTGYGPAHRDAIRGAWGGPDLADVVHLGRALAAARGPGRERPMLYGVSYGAYLALLAAAAQPDLWARVAVVAPFLSGRELYEDGPPTVRTMLDRLGGREVIDDDLGPRDMIRLAGRVRSPLLIVHGERDPIIPVTHSRRLYERLREIGDREGGDLTYLEVAGVGHDPFVEGDGHIVLDRVVDFLHTSPPPSR